MIGFQCNVQAVLSLGSHARRDTFSSNQKGVSFAGYNKWRRDSESICFVSAGQECKLLCIAEVGIRQFAKYSFGFVDDGTRCDDYDENSGLCISGKCQVRPCLVAFPIGYQLACCIDPYTSRFCKNNAVFAKEGDSVEEPRENLSEQGKNLVPRVLTLPPWERGRTQLIVKIHVPI